MQYFIRSEASCLISLDVVFEMLYILATTSLSVIIFLFESSRYCLADDQLIGAVEFLDLGDGAGWELLQVKFPFDVIVWVLHLHFLRCIA